MDKQKIKTTKSGMTAELELELDFLWRDGDLFLNYF